jgi:transcriptional regulator with XRE-family HTH domain
VDIGTRVRAERKALGLSQEALARIAGVSLTMLNRLERGAIDDPHISTLASIAGALNVSLLKLVEDRVEEESSPKATALPEEEVPSEERRESEMMAQIASEMAQAASELREDLIEDLTELGLGMLVAMQMELPKGTLRDAVERALARVSARTGVRGGWEEVEHSARLRERRERPSEPGAAEACGAAEAG